MELLGPFHRAGRRLEVASNSRSLPVMFLELPRSLFGRRRLSFPRAIGWVVLQAVLLPLDARAQEEDEIPPPQGEVSLPHRRRSAAARHLFSGSARRGRTPGIIDLAHNGYKRDRHDMDGLAQYLQSQGEMRSCAADLRTPWRKHRDRSLRQQPAGKASRSRHRCVPSRFSKAMVAFDLEAVKAVLASAEQREEIEYRQAMRRRRRNGGRLAWRPGLDPTRDWELGAARHRQARPRR